MVKFTGDLLIVDADVKNREALCRRLSKLGFNVFHTGDGSDALNLIKTKPADLVLLDAGIPDMTGMNVLKELRNTFTSLQLPIIMVTKKNDGADAVMSLLEAGANDYLTKPVDFPVILAGIQTQLERKRTEEALRECEERYTLAMCAATDGLWDWNLQADKIYYSPRWKSLIGETEDSVGEDPNEWFSRVHPDDIEQVREDIQAHIDNEAPYYENEYRILHSNGDYLWMLGRGLALRDKNGKAYRLAGWQTDITRSKKIDFLTGLPNRVLFMDRLTYSFEKVRNGKGDRTLALIYLDLDNFKLINDNLGHVVGDQLLTAVARRLENTVRSSNLSAANERHTIARLGGDEFIILVGDAASPIDVIHITTSILNDIGSSFQIQSFELFPTVSIGVAFYNHTYQSPDALLQDADMAMHSAKLAGKGRFEIFDVNMRAASVARLQLETEFRRALERREFENYYQAVVSTKTGRIHAFETLVRWRNPARGLIPPLEFIPMAEETGLIVPLGKWVLESACRQACQWQSRFMKDPPLIVSVNISARHFLQSDLLVHCHSLLKEMPTLRNNLILEVTENTLMRDYNASNKLMRRLKDMGISIAMDDFGTGYSSLSYLHQFPFDSLKIDQSFISRFEENNEIVHTILNLGHSLGLKVVAEGVETLKQVNMLREIGCDYWQGYYFSKPVTADEATAMIERQNDASLIPLPPLEQ